MGLHLTETQIQNLRPRVTEYPTPSPSPGRYPPPRPRGSIILPSGRRVTVAAPAEAAQTIVTPSVRLFTFAIGTAATSRSTTSTPRLVGPAIIKAASWGLGGVASGTQAIEFGIAASSILETNVALGLARPWRPIMQQFTAPSAGDIAGRVGDLEGDFVSGLPGAQSNWGIPIIDSNFFITVTNWSSGAGADVYTGNIVIAEQVSPEALEAFF